jgi:hypothetical protein
MREPTKEDLDRLVPIEEALTVLRDAARSLPPGRASAVVMTKIDEVELWAWKAVLG